MSGQKKRKIDRECRVFNKEWTTKYFFIELRSKAVCLICQESVAVFSRHFSDKHGSYANNWSSEEMASTAARLATNLQAQQNIFFRQSDIQDISTKASYLLTYKLAKASKPFSVGEFLKECMVDAANFLCPESKSKFENISLSRRTVTCRIELIDEDLTNNLIKKAESFKFYSLALDKSTDINDY